MKFIAVVFLSVGLLLGCAKPGLLTVDSAMSRTTELVNARDTQLDMPGEIRSRVEEVMQTLMFLVFGGLVDPEKDIEPFLKIDAAEYFLSAGYAALIAQDHETFVKSIDIAEKLVSDAEAELEKLTDRIMKSEVKQFGI